jgi:hypothetical protein
VELNTEKIYKREANGRTVQVEFKWNELWIDLRQKRWKKCVEILWGIELEVLEIEFQQKTQKKFIVEADETDLTDQV